MELQKEQTEQTMEEQIKVWTEEQRQIAAQLQVNPDSDDDIRAICGLQDVHILTGYTEPTNKANTQELYGGVDVSFPENDADDAVAVYVVLDRQTMKVVYQDHMYFALTVPYIPSFLAFREIEPLETLVQRQVQNQPELTPRAMLVDGNGIFHDRHAGIACFLGLRTKIPTIGVGKTLYYGGGWTREKLAAHLDSFLNYLHRAHVGNTDMQHQLVSEQHNCILIKASPSIPSCDPSPIHANNASKEEDDNLPITPTADRSEILTDLSACCHGIALPLGSDEEFNSKFQTLGCALVGHGGRMTASKKVRRIAKGAMGTRNPIFVSVGHSISLQQAVQICTSLSISRIPEPVRQADLIGRELLRENNTSKT